MFGKDVRCLPEQLQVYGKDLVNMMYRYKRLFRKFINNRKYRTKAIYCFLTLTVILVFSVFLMKTTATKAAGSRIRTISSVKIEKNDSLWSIASAYYTDDFESIQDMITEIKQINGLKSDMIKAGNCIVVPYYIDAKEGSN